MAVASASDGGKEGDRKSNAELITAENKRLTQIVLNLEESLQCTLFQAAEHENIASERGHRLVEAETLICELHAIFEQLKLNDEICVPISRLPSGSADALNGLQMQQQREDSVQQQMQALQEREAIERATEAMANKIQEMQADRHELESEILVARRIATFRAVRIAVLQQQQHQSKQEQELELERLRISNQHLQHKLATLQEAQRSVSNIKDRENERMQASLQMVSSRVARLQQENRRLQRLLHQHLEPADAERSLYAAGTYGGQAMTTSSRSGLFLYRLEDQVISRPGNSKYDGRIGSHSSSHTTRARVALSDRHSDHFSAHDLRTASLESHRKINF